MLILMQLFYLEKTVLPVVKEELWWRRWRSAHRQPSSPDGICSGTDSRINSPSISRSWAADTTSQPSGNFNFPLEKDKKLNPFLTIELQLRISGILWGRVLTGWVNTGQPVSPVRSALFWRVYYQIPLPLKAIMASESMWIRWMGVPFELKILQII